MDDEQRMVWRTTGFATWVVLGLFVDGWAHNAGRPETFWTPYHALLYSGFGAAALAYLYERRRQRRAGAEIVADRLTRAGFVVFAFAGLGDAVWHSVFGVEEDIAALLSPTHLALMIGGLFLISGPLRRPLDRAAARAGWREGGPDVVAVLLALSVITFFLQFLSPFHGVQPERYGIGAGEAGRLLGVASILVTNTVLIGGIAFASAHRAHLPSGAATLILGGTALLLSALTGFDSVALVLAAGAGGVLADVLAHGGHPPRTVLLATPAVLWSSWFGTYALVWTLAWPAEYWTGVVVLATLTGWGLSLLVPGSAQPIERHAPLTPRVEAQVPPTDRRATTSLAGRS